MVGNNAVKYRYGLCIKYWRKMCSVLESPAPPYANMVIEHKLVLCTGHVMLRILNFILQIYCESF